MPVPVLRYGLDPTGINPDNLVMDEAHQLANRRIRAISPVEGAFYSDNLVVREAGTGRLLTKGLHYVPAGYYRTISEMYGKAVYGFILVKDPSVQPDVLITYQVVGGIYSGTTETLKNLLEQHRDDGTEFNYYDVIGRPDLFDPTPHLHSVSDGMGFEYMVHALERLRNAILWADSSTYQDIYTYVEGLLADVDARLKLKMDAFITPLLYEFKRTISKATIGLDKVENLALATKEEGAKAGLVETKITDFLERKYIALDAIVAFKDKLYEHLVSKEKTNLGRTQAVFMPPKKRTLYDMPNGGTVTFISKREALATADGFDSNAYPPGISEDMRVTIVKVVNNRNNSGGIFISYFADGSQAYIGHSSTGTLSEDIVWKKFLFTEDLQYFVDMISSHITNTNNPHKVRKDQVGLGDVENLPVITREEILCLKSVRKYMTFDAFLLFMKAFMIGKNGSAADPGSESGEPLDNCQIIYCPCSPCGCGDGGTTPPPPSCPAYGTLKGDYCDGFTKRGIYHNGACGTYEQIIATNSPECGYTPPAQPPGPGTVVSWSCSGTTKISKIADGAGGTYDRTEANSPDCGYQPPTPSPTPPPPAGNVGISISINPSSLAIGPTPAQLSTQLSGMVVGRTYTISYKFKPPGASAFIAYYSPVNHTATSSNHNFDFPLNNFGDITPGRAEFVGTIVESGNSSNRADSQAAYFTYLGDKKVTIRIQNSTTGLDLPAGTPVFVEYLFENMPANKTLSYNVFNFGTNVGTLSVQTDSTGRGYVSNTAAIVDANFRGQQQWKLVATWAIGDWAGGGTRTTESNSVTINWTGGGVNPPPGTELSRRCDGTTLVITYANGSGGSYDQATPNSPACVNVPTPPPSGSMWKQITLIGDAGYVTDAGAKFDAGSGTVTFYWTYGDESTPLAVGQWIQTGYQVVSAATSQGGSFQASGGVLTGISQALFNTLVSANYVYISVSGGEGGAGA